MCAQLALEKLGDAFSKSVCWMSRDLKPPTCVRMTRFVPDQSQELMAPSTGLKLFGMLTHPQKIGDFQLWMQKTLLTRWIILESFGIFPFMVIRSSFFLIAIVTGNISSCDAETGRPVFCTVVRVWHMETHFLLSPMVLAFICWSNNWKWNFLTSPIPGTLTMLAHLARFQSSSYILFR